MIAIEKKVQPFFEGIILCDSEPVIVDWITTSKARIEFGDILTIPYF